jgi:hypothetical protein
MTEERTVSPDGRYVWDGSQWVPNISNTVSPDGLYVWDGRKWLPNAPAQTPVPTVDATDVWPMAPKLPKKEGALLLASLNADEQVLGRLVGVKDQVLVATDRRVLILKHGSATGTAFGSKATSYAYHLLTAIEVRTGVAGCILEVSAAGIPAAAGGRIANRIAPNAVTFARKQLPEVQTMANKLRERVGQAAVAPATAAAINPTDQLRSLAELRDAGILTDEEFAAKKAEILARL